MDTSPNEYDEDATDAEYSPEKDDDVHKSEQKKRGSNSIAWKHYRMLPNQKAECNYCHNILSYRTAISNLIKHLRAMHNSVLTPEQGIGNENKTRVRKRRPRVINRDKKRRSAVWRHFEILPGLLAKCSYCKKKLSYKTNMSNLSKHLHLTHQVPMPKRSDYEDSFRPSSPVQSSPRYKPQKHFRSATWKYFDVVDEPAKIASCRLCSHNFSYNSLTNLKKHLVRKHDAVVDASSDEEGGVEAEIDDEPSVWVYFRCLDEALKIASCLICKKRVEYSNNSDLDRHLRRKHPRVAMDAAKSKPKKLMITGNGDIFEIDEDVAKQEPIENHGDNDSDNWPYNNEEVDTLHAEYIDEDLSDDQRRSSSKKKRKRTSIHRVATKQKSVEENTLDIFGQYMILLLKKLPKHKSDQLQVDFIRQIMEAQDSVQNSNHNSNQNSSSKPICHDSNSNLSSVDDARVTSNSEVLRVIDSGTLETE